MPAQGSESQWKDDDFCFGCGRQNPQGFQMEFVRQGQGLTSSVTFQKSHQGYADIVHGGFLTLVLDEIMTNVPIYIFGVVAATVEFNIRLKKMVKVGETVSLQAKLTGQKSRLYKVEGSMMNRAGEVVSEAKAVCLKVGVVDDSFLASRRLTG